MSLSNVVRNNRNINKFNLTKTAHRIAQNFTVTVSPNCRYTASVPNKLNKNLKLTQFSPNITSTQLLTNVNHKYNYNSRELLFLTTHRCYSTDEKENDSKSNDGAKRDLPSFGDEEFIMFPSIFYSIKNIISTFLIRAYFDEDFDRKEFIVGSKYALQIVSNKLAAGDLDALHGLLDPSTLQKMKKIVGPMTVAQRREIAVDIDNIVVAFPYEIQFITEERGIDKKSRFFVEIMVVYHVLREWTGLSDIMVSNGKKPDLNKNFSIANYRFIKEFTKGVEDDWTINYIFHVKPSDEVTEQQSKQPKGD